MNIVFIREINNIANLRKQDDTHYLTNLFLLLLFCRNNINVIVQRIEIGELSILIFCIILHLSIDILALWVNGP